MSLAAAMGGGAASAAARTGEQAPRLQPIAKLERQTEARMLSGKPVAFLRGDVVIKEPGINPANPQDGLRFNIKNAFLVDRSNANTMTGFKDIEESGEYAVGYMKQTGDKPNVVLLNYDANNMSIVLDSSNTGPSIQYALFQHDNRGGINLHAPIDSYDAKQHGGPLVDPAGNPEALGFAYVPAK